MDRDLNKLDTIELSDEMLKRIIDWYGDHGQRERPEFILPLTEGVLRVSGRGDLDDNTIYFKFNEDGLAELESYTLDAMLLAFTYNIETAEVTINDAAFPKGPYLDLVKKNTQTKGAMQFCIGSVAAVLCYMGYYQGAEKQVTETRTRTLASKKPRKGEKKNRKVYISKTKYIVHHVEGGFPKRTFERHTEAWPVRGHPRTYKSGKTIWIAPFIKGDKKKYMPEPSMYKIKEEKNLSD